MNNAFTEIVCVVDRSGSMDSICSDAIGGFNTFLKGQKELPGSARLSLVLFNHIYTMVQESIDIKDVPELNDKTYVPGGNTALLDAVGRTIDDLGYRLSNTPKEKRPDKIIVAILTDGLENASKVYTYEKVSEMIQLQQDKYSWEFVYLGANQNAFEEAARLSIAAKDTMSWQSTREGTIQAFKVMNSSIRQRRSR